MAVVARIGIENSFRQKLRRIDGLLNGLILIAYTDAVTVAIPHVICVAGIYLTAGGNYVDRIRHAQQQTCFKEIGQEFMVKGDGKLMVINDTNSREIWKFTRDVLVIAQNMLSTVNLATDLFNFRAHHEQQGECIIPRSYRLAIDVIKIFIQCQEIGPVSDLIFSNHDTFHNGLINQVYTLVLIPVDQVVAVNQGAHIDISRIIAEHLCKEIALGDGGVTHA